MQWECNNPAVLVLLCSSQSCDFVVISQSLMITPHHIHCAMTKPYCITCKNEKRCIYVLEIYLLMIRCCHC
uniref:Uncharacterized protein n=1 Tax=Pyxicephalus adspersus TaxID=30357 RepID=A0AAV2ZXH8_PYXAD|nr:TPA: hypothetical protein GDO54_014222 [Pyxicephalus adspersus]